jgi:branched-chain amino acid transport system substrate-binding protein
LTAPDKLHPYVFRTASTTTIEGRSAAELAAKLPNVKLGNL